MRAASEMFRDRGYHNVSLADVAESVGITPGGVYRHFRNKEELLLRTVENGLDGMEAMVRDASDLDEFIVKSGTMALERRALAALWQRESRHLSDAQREPLRARLSEVVAHTSGLLGAERRDLPQADVEFLTWALFAVFTSFGVHRIAIPKRDFLHLHHQLCVTVVDCTLVPGDAISVELHGGPAATSAAIQVPRREQLVTEATRLFDERGFQSVSVVDIGAAVGIAGSSVYKHFPSKTDLLAAALVRGSEKMHAGMTGALAQAQTPQEALIRVLRAHIDFAVDHSRLIGILMSEREELPEKERKATYRAQRDYTAVWLRLIGEARPELTTATAKIVVDTVFAVINNSARTRRLAIRPDLRTRLAEIGSALLFAPLPVA
ncbi:hypothetical protein AXA44_18105 [Rhodococcus sp. SC4]|nr:hypothetical protein AXA44_18105 [Rhodococcus sp. SC4]